MTNEHSHSQSRLHPGVMLVRGLTTPPAAPIIGK
jgi:hypothetical protein